ncbi:MAG: DNA-binding protein HU [Candidatus Harrisonbacteria bacterium CG10_big_fil_rev_8_21_14_0_10_45_28]|uniref:DNA-binding protein HU n=1 Tax=Candidatus Harrisonbacteria bacterium CG10_big_fil_rev_8_21_14_0_10_45_28 TaxID=1974586 RepID=A0A2H0UNA0_9BACT|nr:MAG: DNA-binding protein HU [Candidatus Harrisonbacteria bacterium CG10_big_fil_rev_8_21_14_0_10_45_28]
MKKDDLVVAIMNGAELATKKHAQEVVDLFFVTITKALKKGDSVGITGFGTFKVVNRKAREGVNPKTGARIKIPAAKKPKFTPGKGLKDAVK